MIKEYNKRPFKNYQEFIGKRVAWVNKPNKHGWVIYAWHTPMQNILIPSIIRGWGSKGTVHNYLSTEEYELLLSTGNSHYKFNEKSRKVLIVKVLPPAPKDKYIKHKTPLYYAPSPGSVRILTRELRSRLKRPTGLDVFA